MRVGVSMFAGDGGKSGISQYLREVVTKLLAQYPDLRLTLFMSHSDRAYFDPHHPNAKVISYPDWVGHPIVNIFWHLLILPWVLYRQRCELVFLPAANRRLGWYYPCPSVGTVHDISQLHIPTKYDAFRMFYIMRVLPRLMRRLTRVISISRSTTRDLEGFAKVEPTKIDLVYNGADTSRFTPDWLEKSRGRLVAAGLKLDQPYILYVSRIEHPGKNHVGLLEAFHKSLPDLDPDLQLVFVGARWNGADKVDEKIQELGLGDRVIFPGFVSNDLLPDLYRSAELLAFPSLYEGFGIPALEAMASGIPAIVADNSSLPEVVGSAGLCFDPKSIDAMSEVLTKLSRDEWMKDVLGIEGILQASKFSWELAAQGVYQSFLSALAAEKAAKYHPVSSGQTKNS